MTQAYVRIYRSTSRKAADQTLGKNVNKGAVVRINIALWDRLTRLIVGIALVGYAVAGGPVWAYFGLALIGTGAWRFDPIYALLRTGTLRD